MQSISKSELVLMHIIWDNEGSARYAQIIESLEARGQYWPKNTSVVLLGRLVEKGYLKTSKIGRRNEYTALISEVEYAAAETESHIAQVYEGNVMGLINTLLQKNLISDEEKELLRKQWEGGGTDG